MGKRISYKRAFYIACDILNGSVLYGIDADFIFDYAMKRYGVVSTDSYFKFISENIDRFSDDDNIRHKAIERLGF